MQLKPVVLGLILILCLFPISQTIAQQESTSILMNIVPSNPSPGENVSITLSSYAENLDIATITWFMDGKNVLSGVGEKSFLLKAPNFGFETKITAKIKMAYEETQVSTIIRPAQMVMLWQATDSYVPPFYKGKALPTIETTVKVVSIPEIKVAGTFVNQKNLSYVWQKDFNNFPSESGYGKNYFIFKNDYFDNSNDISVTAYTVDQKYSAQGIISVGTFTPSISFYRKDENLGILWDNALSDNHFVENSDVIVASPYFISPKDIRIPFLNFNWSINGTLIRPLNENKQEFPVQTEEGISGTAIIKLEVDNINKLYQNASKEVYISF